MATHESAFREIDPLGFEQHSEMPHRPQPWNEQLRNLARLSLSHRPLRLRRVSSVLISATAAAALLLAAVLAKTSGLLSFVPAVTFGLAIGFCLRWAGISWRSEQLLQPPNLLRVATFQFRGHRIQCSFGANLLPELRGERYQRVFDAVIGGLAAILAVFDTAFTNNRFVNLNAILRWHLADIYRALWVLLFAVGFAWYGDWQIEKLAVRKFKRRVAARVTSASDELCHKREIDGVLAGINALCKAMNVEASNDIRTAIDDFVNRNCTRIVLDAKYADSFTEAITELARQDLAHLSASLTLYQQLQSILPLARSTVKDCGNPFHEIQLDTIESRISDMRVLLTQRRWTDFQQSVTEIQEELQVLQERATARQQPSAVLAPGTDPYRLLGIDRGTPTPRIRRLRTRLAQLYHPDASDAFPNSSRMAEVNAAFDAVLTERHER